MVELYRNCGSTRSARRSNLCYMLHRLFLVMRLSSAARGALMSGPPILPVTGAELLEVCGERIELLQKLQLAARHLQEGLRSLCGCTKQPLKARSANYRNT